MDTNKEKKWKKHPTTQEEKRKTIWLIGICYNFSTNKVLKGLKKTFITEPFIIINIFYFGSEVWSFLYIIQESFHNLPEFWIEFKFLIYKCKNTLKLINQKYKNNETVLISYL